jgi:hypothetical protein
VVPTIGNLLSAQVNQNKQTALNDIYQQSSQSCAANCVNIQSGNTIFLDGSTVGDITFEQKCTASASCVMNNAVESLVQQLQKQKQDNKTEASLFGGGFNIGTVNLNQSEQEITNRVKQILNTLCSADVNNLQTDNMIYARNSKTGNISFTQDGAAEANCIMTNMASSKARQDQLSDQTNATAASLGMGGILGLVVMLIVVSVVASVVRKMNKAQQDPDGDSSGGPPGGNGGKQKKTQGGSNVNFDALASKYSGGK